MTKPFASGIRGLGLSLLMTLALIGCAEKVSESEYSRDVSQALQSGDTPTATILLKNMLQAYPGSGVARRQLAGIYLKDGDWASAEKEFQRAIDAGEDYAVVAPGMATALLHQGKYDELSAMATTALPDEALGEVMAAQANSLLVRGEPVQAREYAEAALELNPASLEARRTSALLKAKGNNAYAISQLKLILQEHPDYARGWGSLARLQRYARDYPAAEASLTKAINLRSYNGADYLLRATLNIEQGEYESVQSDINMARKKLPGYHEVDYAQGLLYYYQGELDGALEAFSAAYASYPEYRPTRYYLADTTFSAGNLEQADQLATALVAEFDDFLGARLLLARIRQLQGRYVESEELLAPVMEAYPDHPVATYMFAESLRGQQRYSEEIVELEKFLTLYPEVAGLRVQAASGYLAVGNDEKGLEELALALELDPEMVVAARVWMTYHFDRGEAEEALGVAEAFLQDNPDNAEAYNILGLAKISADSIDEAVAAFDAARKLEPGNPAANHNLAKIAVLEGNYPEARQRVEEVLAHHENMLSSLLLLAQLDRLQERPEEFVTHLGLAIEAHPYATEPRHLLARHYLQSGEFDKAKMALGDSNQQAKAGAASLKSMGEAQLEAGDADGAIGTFENLVSYSPSDAQAYYLLAQAYGKKDDESSVARSLKTSLEIDSNHSLARLNLAQLLYRTGEHDAAEVHYQLLLESFPDDLEIRRLTAMRAVARGDTATALQILEAIHQQVATTETLITLVQLEWKSNKQAEALQRLETWVQQNPNDLAARMFLANGMKNMDNTAVAINQYRQILAIAPENVRALNDLAWLLRDQDREEALSLIEKAIAIMPDDVRVVDTYEVITGK